MNAEIYQAILDSIKHPVVFVDNDHIVRYLNRAAKVRYYEKRGYADLIGKSIFDCHNPTSVNHIKQTHKRLQDGEDEVRLRLNKDQKKVTVVVGVRGDDGRLFGYYERFEKRDV